VTGVDISPESLDAGGERARERDLRIEWRRSEMRDLPWSSEFDAAYCAGAPALAFFS
jgi:ubiquinone/menaquinone biosynthesis C-methylase UbiE